MSKHNSGPWSIGAVDPDTGEIEVTSEGRPYICMVLPGALPDRTCANARLIAAAPELLEASRMLIDSIEGGSITPEEAISAARAAIATATGGSLVPKVAPREEYAPCPGCLDTECNGECMENL